MIERGACPVYYIANESPVAATRVFSPGDFLARIKAAETRGYVDRALFFDTSVRAIVDLLAALDAFCCDEGGRYFKGTPASTFKERFQQLLGLSAEQVASTEGVLRANAHARENIRLCADFLLNYVFTFMKCFDAKRSFEDEANYYMEREWRLGANLQFTLSDVARVFLPARYARRFRADVPAYVNQVTFIDL